MDFLFYKYVAAKDFFCPREFEQGGHRMAITYSFYFDRVTLSPALSECSSRSLHLNPDLNVGMNLV